MSQNYRSLLISRVGSQMASTPCVVQIPVSSEGANALPVASPPSYGLLASRVAPAAALAVAGLAAGQGAQAQSTVPIPALLSGYNYNPVAGPNCGTPGQYPTGTNCQANPLEAAHYLYFQNTTEQTGCNTYSNSCGYWGVSTCTTTYGRSADPPSPMTYGYNASTNGGINGDQNATWFNSGDTERLGGGQSGTLTLNHPEKVKHLYFFESTGSAGGTEALTATLSYTNGTKYVTNFTTSDWWSNTGTGVSGGNAGGQYGTASAGWYTGVNAYVHEYYVDPGSSYYNLTLASVSFTYGGTGYANVFGLSTTAVTPAPPGMLLALGGMGLSGISMWSSRRKRRSAKRTVRTTVALPELSPGS